MPVGERELRRGVELGLYPDPEKARRTEIAEHNAALAAQREERMAGDAAVRTRLDLLRFENDSVKAQAAARAEERVLEDSINATRKLVDIPATTSDFPMRLQKIIAEHPRALSDKAFQEQYQWNTGLHKEWLTQEQARAKLAEEQRAKAIEKVAFDRERAGLPLARATRDGLTYEAPGGTAKVPPVTDINSRLKAEFGVELSELQNPGANMRRVNPAIKDPKNKGANGDVEGSHYAFDVPLKEGSSTTRTVLIPVDRFKSYADEYATATGAQTARTAAPVQTAADKENEAAWARRDAALAARTPSPTSDIHERARAALANGAPKEAVIERLKKLGGDPSKL